jgi:CheY-like chemotaxis protein
VPVHSREWRRHRILTLRYVDVLSPETVAERLAFSRRHYFREQALALEAAAASLWNRRRADVSPDNDMLLQRELSRLDQFEHSASVAEVVDSVLSNLKDIIVANHNRIQTDVDRALPTVSIGRNLLRQVMMTLLGQLTSLASETVIQVSAVPAHSPAQVKLTISSSFALSEARAEEWLDNVRDLLEFEQGSIATLSHEHRVMGFEITLPCEASASIHTPTVLIVDDNADMLILYERFLAPNGYHVITAQSVSAALERLSVVDPFCIIIDLMMPESDGWELLQSLTRRPALARTAIVICSVLKQRELSLALGATAFLEKPITKPALLSMMDALRKESLP